MLVPVHQIQYFQYYLISDIVLYIARVPDSRQNIGSVRRRVFVLSCLRNTLNPARCQGITKLGPTRPGLEFVLKTMPVSHHFSKTMASFLFAILHVILNFLKSCFKENTRKPDPSGANCPNNTDGGDRCANKACTELEATFDSFDMNLGKVRLVDGMENSKRVKLLHHLDSSSNSDASIGLKQMVNRVYDRLERDLASTKQGRLDHKRHRNEPDCPLVWYFEVEGDEVKTLTHKNYIIIIRCNGFNKTASKTKESLSDIEKEERKLRRIEQIAKHGNNCKAKQVNMHTKEERVKIHQECFEHLKKRNNRRIASWKDTAASSTKNGEPMSPSSYPKCIAIEFCNNEIIMAPRMVLPDVAYNVLQPFIDTHFRNSLERRGYTSYCIYIDRNVEFQLDHAVADCILGVIDNNGNTLLHFAVNLELPVLITCFVFLFHRPTNLQHLIRKSNRCVEEAVDLHMVISDQLIEPETAAMFLKANEVTYKARLPLALPSAHHRLELTIKSLDLLIFLTTAMSIAVGCSCFGCGYLTSVMTIGIVRYMFGTFRGSDAAFLAHLFGLHSTWITFWYSIRFVRHLLPSEHVLLVIPIGIFLCGSTPGNKSCFMFTFQMFQLYYRDNFENIVIPKAVIKRGLGRIYLLGLLWAASCTAALVPFSFSLVSEAPFHISSSTNDTNFRHKWYPSDSGLSTYDDDTIKR